MANVAQAAHILGCAAVCACAVCLLNAPAAFQTTIEQRISTHSLVFCFPKNHALACSNRCACDVHAMEIACLLHCIMQGFQDGPLLTLLLLVLLPPAGITTHGGRPSALSR
jgi:hypothetical protein